MHFGGIIVPPGYTDPIKFADGNPYGVSHITGPDNTTQVAEPTTQRSHIWPNASWPSPHD
jgi:NAD(P)H dehydrogenase (quinone)